MLTLGTCLSLLSSAGNVAPTSAGSASPRNVPWSLPGRVCLSNASAADYAVASQDPFPRLLQALLVECACSLLPICAVVVCNHILSIHICNPAQNQSHRSIVGAVARSASASVPCIRSASGTAEPPSACNPSYSIAIAIAIATVPSLSAAAARSSSPSRPSRLPLLSST